MVSVPLRGCGFEILMQSFVEEVNENLFPSPCGDVVLKFCVCSGECTGRRGVSVPLRGCGFEISVSGRQKTDYSRFPSPCGDVVLK